MKITLMILWLTVIASSFVGSAITFLYSWREGERSSHFESTRKALQDSAAPDGRQVALTAGSMLSSMFSESVKNFGYVGASSMLTFCIATVAFFLQFVFFRGKRNDHTTASYEGSSGKS